MSVRPHRILLLVGGLLALNAGAALAQRQSCDIANSRQIYSVAGGAVIYLGGPVFACPNGTRILADSAVYVRSTGRIDFMGNVRFNELRRSLTSQYAQYLAGNERKLMAQGSVVLTDKDNGTTLRAQSIDYLQETPTRQARIDALSGRPVATIIRRKTPGGNLTAGQPVDTTRVESDQLTIFGEQSFRGRGNVNVYRGKMTSNSSYAEFDQTKNYMKLTGGAVVRTDTFTLSGDTIEANTTEADEFKDLRARVATKLKSNDIDVEAPGLNVTFTEGAVTRVVAIGGARLGGAAQARATSQDFVLIADSIDAVTPGQKLETVVAVGKAFGERRPDSLDAKLPDLVATDWVRGDTVRAFFVDAVPAPGRVRPDTAGRVVDRIVAAGAPASSTYRLRENRNGQSEVSVNYLTARTIDVVMKNGSVDRVNAAGDIRGVYLQPPRRTAQVRP